MRIAFASSDGRNVNEHFGHAESFYLWEIGPDKAEPVGRIRLQPDLDEREDRILARAAALDGCTLVYTTQIGGPAAAKLVGRHIQPVKAVSDTPIAEAISKLQDVLKGNAPPWLRKAMATGPSDGADTSTQAPAQQ